MLKNILITGGAGFIGSNFVEHLFNNYPEYRVMVLDVLTYAGNPENIPEHIKKSPRFQFWYGSITNDALVQNLVEKSDIVIHFAAESHVARSLFDNKIFYETDVLGTQAVANAIVKKGGVERFIHISTSEVYGTAETEPMGETHPLNPKTPYASAKCGADRLVYSYIESYNIPGVLIRPFNNYGPKQHLEKVIPRFITSALMNEPLTIHGSGENTRDWLFVQDHCKALDKVLHAPLEKIKGEVINLGTGKEVSVIEIASSILRILNKKQSLITFTNERLGQVKKHLSSTEKSHMLLDWTAQTSFEEGLLATINWYKNNTEWWEKQLWMKKIPIITNSGEIEYH